MSGKVFSRNKCIKQGLSRSDSGFEHPCLMYWIVVKPFGGTVWIRPSVYGFWDNEKYEKIKSFPVRVCPKFCVNTEMQCKIEPK